MKTIICGIPNKNLENLSNDILFYKGKKYYGDNINQLESELGLFTFTNSRWQKEFTFTVEDIYEDGDILITKTNHLFIFKGEMSGKVFCHAFVSSNNSKCYTIGGWACNSSDIAGLANEKQQQKLFDALKELGKVWNPKTKCIENIKYEPKRGEVVKGADYMFIFNGKNSSGYNTALYPILISNNGNLFTPKDFWTEFAEPTTPEERTVFFNALTKAGYKYNSKRVELTKIETGFDFSKLNKGDFLSFEINDDEEAWFIIFNKIKNSELLHIGAASGDFYSNNGCFDISEIDQSTIKVLNREI